MTQGELISVPRHAGNGDENFRFTLARADAWLRGKAGVRTWSLDAAACNESHLAARYYTLEHGQDGLVLPWFGATFINPPWDDIEPWVERACQSWWAVPVDREDPVPLQLIAMLLPLRTHMPWWQRFVEPFRDQPRGIAGGPRGFFLRMYCPPERFTWGAPGNPRGIGAQEPNFQAVGLVWRRA